MPRPRSIVLFEICYLAALAANILGPVLIWPALMASVAEQAHVQPRAAGAVAGVVIAVLVVAVALSLLLWWLVARRASGIARWVVVVLLGYSIYSSVSGLIVAEQPFDLTRGIALVAIVLEAVALVALFAPDARGWFAREPDIETEDHS